MQINKIAQAITDNSFMARVRVDKYIGQLPDGYDDELLEKDVLVKFNIDIEFNIVWIVRFIIQTL